MRHRIGTEIAMAWSMEGQLFECCNCEVVCPCSAYPFQGADYDRCITVFTFHVDSGQIEGVDVAKTLVAVVGDLPKYFLEGNWRVGLLVDEAASDEQAAKLTAVFSGELGGPLAALSGLISENLGVERVPMQFSAEGGSHVLTVGNQSRLAIRDLVPTGVENGPPARLTGEFHPLTAAGLSDGEVTSVRRRLALILRRLACTGAPRRVSGRTSPGRVDPVAAPAVLRRGEAAAIVALPVLASIAWLITDPADGGHGRRSVDRSRSFGFYVRREWLPWAALCGRTSSS
jgi:hypothetical protein